MIRTKTDDDVETRLSPELGVRNIVRLFLVQSVLAPIKTLGSTPNYYKTFRMAWARRQRALLGSYISIGLPDEQSLLDDLALEKVASYRKFIKNQKVQIEPSASRLARRLHDMYIRLKRKNDISAKVLRQAQPTNTRLLYVVHQSIAKKTNGYTIRTHTLLKALITQGWTVQVLVRPTDTEAYDQTIDGINYIHLGAAIETWNNWPEYENLFVCQITEAIDKFSPSAVQAASNHISGRSALLASNKSGTPFIYEVRGLWHVTRESKISHYSKTLGWKVQEIAEADIIKNADHVFVLNTALKARIVAMGANENKISLLENAGSLPIGEVNRRASTSTLQLGYIGSLVSYEGLDVLIKALSLLPNEVSQNIHLNIYGAGEQELYLRELIERKSISNTHFHGLFKNSPSKLRSIYENIDLVVIPRTSNNVTNLVCPLKPYEAASYGCPALVSDVSPLLEFSKSSAAAIVFKADSPSSLANKLVEVYNDRDRLKKLSENGLRHIKRSANWSRRAEHMTHTVNDLKKISQSKGL